MASRFWVGGTGNWDSSDTTHWAASSGGAGGQSVPTSADTVTFDGSSGGGTVTVAATLASSNTISSLTAGAFTGTLDFATNNPSLTMATMTIGGSGTRTINLGSGTFTLTGTSGTIFDCNTVSNLTLNAGTSTILLSATPSGTRNFLCGAKTLNNITVTNAAMNQSTIDFANGGAFTCNNLTFTNVQGVRLNNATTVTISGTWTWDGNSTNQGLLYTNGSSATVSVANANVLSWLAVQNITKSGAGSITVNNGFNGGGNTSVTINAPSGGASKVGISPGFS